RSSEYFGDDDRGPGHLLDAGIAVASPDAAGAQLALRGLDAGGTIVTDQKRILNRHVDRRTIIKGGAASAGLLAASRFGIAAAQDASPAADAGPGMFTTADYQP